MTVNISKHENELAVSFDYSQERIAKVKSIKGHKWNANDKTWNIPFTEDNLAITNISVLTNLSEAHLDFHGSYDIYKNMKKRIFNHHTKSDIAILNLDDKEVLGLTTNVESSKKYFLSRSLTQLGCSIIDGYICYNNNIIALDEVKIKGSHNYEKAMAAIAVVKELGVDNSIITSVLKIFSGLEHRIEYVKNINKIDFYNDSKATNVTSTQIALGSFVKPTILFWVV